MKLNPFFRCHCGKLHVRGSVSVTSVCKCGLMLWKQAWGEWKPWGSPDG